MNKLNYFIVNETIYLYISQDEIIDNIMQQLITKFPNRIGKVTAIKKDNFDNERYYNYEIDNGKYRKYRFTKHLKWKDSNGKTI